MTLTSISRGVAIAALAAIIPATAFADTLTSANVNTSVQAGAPGITAGFRGDIHATSTIKGDGTTAKAKADDAITKRIDDLNKALTRFGQVKKLSSDEQASLSASINAEISTLTALKAKIDADTDTTTLKTDIESIAKDYRVYMVVLPQAHITAAADRIQAIVSAMGTISTKLQARISAAQSTGKDVSAATSAYTDFQAKIADAGTQATAATTAVANLKPDQGDATVAASNKTALQAAAAAIKTATQDLQKARADISVIVKATVAAKTSTSASTTVQ